MFQGEQAVSTDKMRSLAEVPWLTLLPREERAALERVDPEPDAEEWAALVASDRTFEAAPSRPDRSSRALAPVALAGLVAAIVLVVDGSQVGESARGAGGSSPTVSGAVAAAASEVPERNRAALAPAVRTGDAEPVATTTRSKRKPRAGGSPARPPKPPADDGGSESPPRPPPPEGEIPVPRVEVPPVEPPPVEPPPVEPPPVQLPPVQLPQLPPVQLPQLPPLLPSSGQ
jgi:hypothetical protein